MRIFPSARPISDLFDRLLRSHGRYSQVLIVSPFIDAFGEDVLRRISGTAIPSIRICTRPSVATRLRETGVIRGRILECPNLHAKAYIAVGKSRQDGEVILSSANLTRAGLSDNLEVSIRLSPISVEPSSVALSLLGRITHKNPNNHVYL